MYNEFFLKNFIFCWEVKNELIQKIKLLILIKIK